MRNITVKLFVLLFCSGIIWSACGRQDDVLPKPRGYFRIDLPDTGYVMLDSIERYRFEYPQYAVITNDPYSPQEKNWINVEMPVFKASIHITHKNIEGNLGQYLDDVHTMITKHLQKANGIRDSLIINDEHQRYGMFIEMDGKGVATPFQFYLTDSTHNFVRGALYFNFLPNNDSMQPVISRIRQDVDHMINTFEWKY